MDLSKLDIRESRVVLKKFEGDDQTGEPVETIIIENGKIVQIIKKGEVENGAH